MTREIGNEVRDAFLAYANEQGITQIEMTTDRGDGRDPIVRVRDLSFLTSDDCTVQMADSATFADGVARFVSHDSMFNRDRVITIKAA